MAKCKNCSIEILDETEVCPLCQAILVETEPVENMYPNARVRMRRLLLLSRVYLFCAILAEALLMFIDWRTPGELQWSLIAGLGLLAGYFVLRYAIVGRSGYRSKLVLLVAAVILLCVGIDYIIGFRGWSLHYVLPGGILLVDGGILLCMILNRRNWQSYMMFQLLMILCSLLPIVFQLTGLAEGLYMTFLPLCVSAALFLGTLLIGDHRARTELRRRFHIQS